MEQYNAQLLEKLHLLVELLREFNLPISPILEYEIKQREETLSASLPSLDNAPTGHAEEPVPNTGPTGKSNLSVCRGNGIYINGNNAAQVLCNTINAIGADKVHRLNIRLDGTNLVSMGGNDMPHPCKPHDLGNGYFVNTHSNTLAKKRQIERILQLLNLDWTVVITVSQDNNAKPITTPQTQYLSKNDGNNKDLADPYTDEPNPAQRDLETYVRLFSNMSVGINNGRKLPHKAVLLLTICSLIEEGSITDNAIPIDNILSKAFAAQWSRYYYDTKVPSVWIPFWYMKSEPFWHFKSNDCNDTLATLLKFAGHPSKGQMLPIIKYAYLDKELYAFLLDKKSKVVLCETLIETYITA